MLQLTATRGISLLLNSVQCSCFKVWSRQYLTRTAPLLQSTSCYILKVKTTPSTSLRDEIFHRGYFAPHSDNVETKFSAINISSLLLTTRRHFSSTTTSHQSPDEKKSTQPKHPSPVDDGYVPVYKFKYIVYVHTLCRMKIFQTALVTALLPFYIGLGMGSPDSLQFLGLVGAASFAGLMLCVMGEVFRKFVGRVYYHPVKETVCVSHLSFWGSRKDDYFELSDVVPISDMESNLDDIYLTMKLYSDPSKSFLISFRLGEILNEQYFPEVFGFLPK